jgi:trans-aconitate 2-methyltransferase
VVQGRLGAQHHQGARRGVSADTWDPVQYQQFRAERDQPFLDLLLLVEPAARPTMVDLGCGDGRLTAVAHAQLGAAATLGIDSSPAMLAEAPALDGLRFEAGDIGSWSDPGAYDIILSNAALQWVADHPAVLARWAGSLAPGGQLAVQLPANADHPSHTVLAEVTAELGIDAEPDPVATNGLPPEQYAAVLDDLGAVRQHVRLQVYAHRLESSAAVVEWVKGTTLTRVRRATDEQGYAEFLDRYRQRLLAVIGDRSPYTYLFKRIHLWARF